MTTQSVSVFATEVPKPFESASNKIYWNARLGPSVNGFDGKDSHFTHNKAKTIEVDVRHWICIRDEEETFYFCVGISEESSQFFVGWNAAGTPFDWSNPTPPEDAIPEWIFNMLLYWLHQNYSKQKERVYG